MADGPNDDTKTGDATKASHLGRPRGDGPVNPAIERASTLVFAESGKVYGEGRTYGLMGMGVHDALAEALTALAGGARTVLTSSGLSACTLPLLTFARPGKHVLITDSVYGPTRRFGSAFLQQWGVEVEYYDPRIGAGIAALIRDETALIFLEAPGSLTFEIQDIPAICAAAKERSVPTVIDDTWSAGGIFCKPLALGCDMAVQALTKYPSGGSDVFGGAIVCTEDRVADQLFNTIRVSGEGVSPDSAALILRGLRSMSARLARHEESGLEIAHWLESRPEVARIIHPALKSHPDHKLWRRDFTGAAGLFGVVLNPAPKEKVEAFIDALELFGCGFSWGGFESLAIHCDPQIQRTAVPWSAEGPLVRLSIGLEDADDLIADLEQALSALA